MYVKKNNEIKIKKQFLGAIQILRDTQVGVHTNFFCSLQHYFLMLLEVKKYCLATRLSLKRNFLF